MTDAEPSVATGRMKRLAIGILVFIGVYTGLWFLAAHQIETRLAGFLAGRAGATAECDGLAVRGYPFRIGLFCDGVKIDDRRRGASASFAALRSAAQVYRPGHAVVELDGPAVLHASSGLSISADWEALRASVEAGLSGVDRISIASDRLAGTLVPAPGDDGLALAADHAEFHLRRNGADLDAAASVTKLELKPGNSPSLLPLLAAAVDMTIKDRATALQRGGFVAHALRGGTGEVRSLTLDLGSGMVTTASGPFTVDDRGLISGAFKVTMRDVQAWRKALIAAFPDGETVIDNTANMLTALAAGRNDATVTLNVRDGTAFLAFIPIGVLPEL